MQTIKRIGQSVLLGGLVFLFFILAFQHRLDIPSWLKIAGRMHPMFLHFPIVLLLLSFISLWIPFHEKNVWKWFDGVRLIAALSAVITAIMGLLLSVDEERTGRVLEWHKWSGILVAVFGSLFYAFDSFFLQRHNIGKVFTIVAALTITITGHWGADLTHGENYLLAPLAADRKVPLEEAMVFQDVIKPILDNKCVSCHGEASTKGGLLLDNAADLMKGGKTGPLFVPGQPELSLLIKRIHLPKDDKKHMPPKSKPELADDEIALLEAWIKSGALLNRKVVSLPAQDSFRLMATRFLGTEESVQNPEYSFAAADNKTIMSLNTNYRVIKTLGIGSPALSVHFYGKAMFTPKSLEEILKVKDQITELDLARMPVKDEDLKLVAQMPNLRKVNLNYTDITGKGLGALSSLKNLEEISLSGTPLSADALAGILSLPKLQSVFVWNTPIDSSKIAALRSKHKNILIESGFVDRGSEMIALSPPLIRTPGGVIEDPVQVEIKHPIAGVGIRYTLDGSPPDSLKSPLYKQPITVNDNVIVTARAFKDGWYGSDAVTATYIRKGLQPDSLEMLLPVDPRYRSVKPEVLYDGDLGDLNYDNGPWLGYRQNAAAYMIHYDKPVTVKTVLLNMLQNTASYIFPPAEIQVFGGIESKSLKLLGKINPSIPARDEPPVMMLQKVSFPATEIRFLKILIKNLDPLPAWHPGKKEAAWVYLSEVVVN